MMSKTRGMSCELGKQERTSADQTPTLGQNFNENCGAFSGHEALIFEGRRITYDEVLRQVNRLAKGLIVLGIKKGDKVAIWMPNRPEWVYAMYALAKVGAIPVMVNTRLKLDDLVYVLRQSDSKAIILPDRAIQIPYIETFAELCPELGSCSPGELNSGRFPELRHVICLGEKSYDGCLNYLDVLGTGDNVSDSTLLKAEQGVRPSDIMNIVYTSGTTAFPKGVMLTHHMNVRKGFLLAQFKGLDSKDRLLLSVPLFGVLGYLNGVIPTFCTGGCVVLREFFEPEGEMALIEKERCTMHYSVPMMVYAMLEHPTFHRYDLRSLRGGEMSFPLTIEMAKILEKTLGTNGFSTAYGLTEATGISTWLQGKELLHYGYTNFGRPVPGYEVRIANPETAEDVSSGEVGEILVRSFGVMVGYYKKPEETASAIDSQGWLHTGDLGTIDERGLLLFRGRKKDMYKTSGFNVSCQEVEAFLMTHPKVKEVAVIGVPDRMREEVGMAFILCHDSQICTEEEIFHFCEGRIANFKIPRHVKFVKEFPRSAATAKIQKFELRERALKGLQCRQENG